ncbi:MAG: hypothetical protein ACI4VH_06895 [Clostridia bacterium]
MIYGLYQVDYCSRENDFKILWINIKLFFIWLFRIKLKKEEDK